MFKQHVGAKLSAYGNGELSKAEAQIVAEHLLRCPKCHKEYDEIKRGMQLAKRLPELTAPDSLRSEIENLLDAEPSVAPAAKSGGQNPRTFFAFAWHRLALACVMIFLLAGVAMVVYRAYFAPSPAPGIAVAPSKPEVLGPPDTVIPPAPPVRPDVPPGKRLPAVAVTEKPARNKSEVAPAPPEPNEPLNSTTWEVARLAGTPKIGQSPITGTGKIAIGQWLETDNASRAQITVGEIGQVEVAPNTRIKLVEARQNQHRLQLDVGRMHAKIYAPPRLFLVDTPTAQAIDLGCEYTLEVDDDGTSILRVKSGWVALAGDGRESLVPEGARAMTRRGFAPGTPFFEDTSQKFKQALERFDFEQGGKAELDVLIKEATVRDTLTLWHLLSRVGRRERLRLYNRLVRFVPLPDIVTRAGILRLDKEMLRYWKMDLEVEWYAQPKKE